MCFFTRVSLVHGPSNRPEPRPWRLAIRRSMGAGASTALADEALLGLINEDVERAERSFF